MNSKIKDILRRLLPDDIINIIKQYYSSNVKNHRNAIKCKQCVKKNRCKNIRKICCHMDDIPIRQCKHSLTITK